jgi:hypothetical protein
MLVTSWSGSRRNAVTWVGLEPFAVLAGPGSGVRPSGSLAVERQRRGTSPLTDLPVIATLAERSTTAVFRFRESL